MKTLITIILILPFAVFAQSKKELIKEVERLNALTDSISKETEKQLHEIDSLTSLLKSRNEQIREMNRANDANPFASDSTYTKPINTGRHLIKSPNANDIVSDENCTVTLQVLIDENGNIVGAPKVLLEKTTTRNTELIKQVSSLVKTQAVYNAVSGAKIEKKVITIRIVAH